MSKQLKNETVKTGRSQAEEMAIALLYRSFPRLKVERNNKTALGKELDIFLPDFNVAVEIDGITHQRIVFSEETFIRTQRNDARKDELAKEKGILLLRIKLPEKSGETYAFLKKEIPDVVVIAIKDWITKKI
jgi:very-short-patch-repair endonuclease